jgi:hypothetical protein
MQPQQCVLPAWLPGTDSKSRASLGAILSVIQPALHAGHAEGQEYLVGAGWGNVVVHTIVRCPVQLHIAGAAGGALKCSARLHAEPVRNP